MFLLALIALSVLALLPLVAGIVFADCAIATGSQAAIRAAAQVLRPDTGMPAGSKTNHPVSLREARLANDASSPSATAGVCPDLAESDDLETCNTTADAPVPTSTYGSPPSASPGLHRAVQQRGLALGVSHDRAGQPCLPRKRREFGLALSPCTASPRPRIKCGGAERTGVRLTASALR